MKRRTLFSEPAIAVLDGTKHIPPKKTGVEFVNKTLPSVQRTAAGLEQYTGTWGDVQAAHLLRRSTFGAAKGDITLLKTKTMSDAVDFLLNISATPPDPPVNNYNNANYTDPNVPTGNPWVTAMYTDGTANSLRIGSWKAWWAGVMLNQSTTILEKMTLFWHNHFATETATVADARYIYKHNALLRQYALGNFRDLTKQITIDPAMLRYLNGYANTKAAPDENYGRELQELFTVGKGPDSHYTEDDVKAAARVLTGWRDNSTTIASYFDPTRHDTGNKQFSSFYNNTVITGKTGADGATEVDDLLTMIFAQNETAKFICRKLYRWFVYYLIDDATEASMITPMAALLQSSNFEIKPVLAALLKSAHFYDPVNIGCVIKNPIDFTVGLCRQFSIAFPAPANLSVLYTMWDYIRSTAAGAQMNLGDPPNVAGWPAYYQEPVYYECWITSDSLPKRNQFSDLLISKNGYQRSGSNIVIDPIAFVNQVSNPSDPTIIVAEFSQLLFPIEITDNQKAFLKNTLLPGLPDYEWTNEWTDFQNNPGDQAKLTAVKSKLQALLKFMMDMPEHHLS